MLNALIVAQASPEGGGNPASTIIFFAILAGIFYFLILRPQRQRAKRQQEIVETLMVGEEIQTVGGILGRIVALGDDWVEIALVEGRMRVLKRAIAGKRGSEDA